MHVECRVMLDVGKEDLTNDCLFIAVGLPEQSVPIRGICDGSFIRLWLLVGNAEPIRDVEFFLVKNGAELPPGKHGNYNFVGCFSTFAIPNKTDFTTQFLYGIFTPESAIYRPEFKPPVGLVQ